MVNILKTTSCCIMTMIVVVFFSSCVNTKRITYLNDVPDSNYVNPYEISLAQFADPKIQAGDILQVSVQTLDPQSATLLGVQSTSTYSVQTGSSGGGSAVIQGYMVDKEGFISIPLVGKINVNGLTTTAVKQLIESKAATYYKDPVVNVRFVNFTVTVLGEVSRPGQFTLSNEKTSVLDIIGAAGDMTPYAKRDQILLIREEDGVKKFIRFDLYKKNTFQSPYFYLRQRDVLYIPPNKSKAISSNANEGRIISFISLGLTVITFYFSVFRK